MPRGESPITPIELEDQPQTRSGLGGMVETTLVRFLERFFNAAGEAISEVIEWGLEILLEAVEEALIDANRPLIQRLIAYLPSDSPLIPYLRAMIGGTSLAGVVSLSGLAAGAASQTAGSLLQVMLRPAQYELDSLMRTARLDASAAVAALWREAISPAEFSDQMSDMGWSEGNTQAWLTILKPLISEADILTLWIREQLSEREATQQLISRGYEPNQIDSMRMVMQVLLGPDDLRSLMFRDSISGGDFRERLRHHGYTDSQVAELEELSWRLVSPGDIIALWQRGEIGEGELARRLKAHGYESDKVAELTKVAQRLTGIMELYQLFWREEISEGELAERVKSLGYDDTQVAEYITLSRRIPGPGDLISMAVREAFDPAYIERHHYMARYPKEFEEWMVKQGYEPEWAEKYWVAHWRLPAVTMAFEMFHREEISEDDLADLLTAHDIAPRWQPHMINIAYRPLTRVDVRRMYGLGVLDETAVYRSYLHLGYSPENAVYMTEFTVRYEAGGERDATKSDILKAYNEGVLSRGEAREALVLLNYTEEWASYYLEMQDLDRERGKLSLETSLLKNQYIEGVIGRGDVYTALGAWNLPDTQIRQLLDSWDITKERMITLPSVGQLEGFLKQDIISEGEYRNVMEQRHYPPEVVGYFLQEIRTQIADAAAKEEDRVRKEAERVAITEVKTEYDVVKAGLDLDIAELKTALAENMVLLGIIVDVELMDEIFRQNDTMKVRVKELQEEKARKKLELTEQLRGMRS